MRKVNESLREVIANEVVLLKDPRLGFVTITGVECAPDLRHAWVFFSALGDEDKVAATGEALRSASRKIQAAVGRQTRLKYTPVLDFAVDPAIEQGIRISRLLHEIEQEDQAE